MAFQELLKVHSVKHAEQKAFDGGVSHRGFPGCVDCCSGLRSNACNCTGSAARLEILVIHDRMSWFKVTLT